MLSSVLAGDKTVEEIVINSREWYAQNDIALITGDAVTRIDRGDRMVHSASGLSVHYDRLLVATGSRPVAPPIPGLSLPGVCAFRDIADVETMLAVSREHRRAVVIGGGLLGLEAAWGLKQRGMKVALVHLSRAGSPGSAKPSSVALPPITPKAVSRIQSYSPRCCLTSSLLA
jgi:nitrite reductase (NADH) large subunit